MRFGRLMRTWQPKTLQPQERLPVFGHTGGVPEHCRLGWRKLPSPVPQAWRMSKSLVPSVVHLVAAALGTVVAGPFGGVIGGFVGRVAGLPTEKALTDLTSKLGDKLSETLFEDISGSLVEKLSGTVPDLTSLYRESLRTSLSTIRHGNGNDLSEFIDWFDNWDRALAQDKLPEFEAWNAKMSGIDFASLFSDTLVRIDAQGSALVSDAPSIILYERPMPPRLLDQIKITLPIAFHRSFSSLITDKRYETAWKQLDFEQIGTVVQSLSGLEKGISIAIKQGEVLIADNQLMQQQLTALLRQVNELKSVQEGLLQAIKDLTKPHPAPWEPVWGQVYDFVGGIMGNAGAAISGGAIAVSDATISTIVNIQNGLGWLSPQVADSPPEFDPPTESPGEI
jgi:hypothetical protein